jgi:hypothetical protein
MIDVIVGTSIMLFGAYLYFWARSAALREQIEQPKHVFLQQVQEHDRGAGDAS